MIICNSEPVRTIELNGITNMSVDKFNIAIDTMVVTSSYITKDRMPILCVSHEEDEDEGSVWQFHCGNGDYSEDKIQLVRLSTILSLDPDVLSVSDLPSGFEAVRKSIHHDWSYRKEGN